MTRTREEIDNLKAGWLENPCWDIEDTEGFEEHHEELQAFHAEWRSKWEEKAKADAEKRRALFEKQTGIDDPELALHLWTFKEIASHTYQIASGDDDRSLSMAKMQVDALLLIGVQLKRIADAMEQDEVSGNIDFMTRLYKTE